MATPGCGQIVLMRSGVTSLAPESVQPQVMRSPINMKSPFSLCVYGVYLAPSLRHIFCEVN